MQIKILSFFLKSLIFYFRSIRISVKNSNPSLESLLENKAPMVLYLWHDELLLGLSLLLKMQGKKKMYALVSGSRDGGYLSSFLKNFKGVEIIRVKHLERYKSLKECEKILTQENVLLLITPDGPRGPRRIFKEGIFWIAQTMQTAVIKLVCQNKYTFSLSTWDKMQVPLPFSKNIYELRIVEPPHKDKECIKKNLLKLEDF